MEGQGEIRRDKNSSYFEKLRFHSNKSRKKIELKAMDFMMDEELDVYFVLILFMLKMKNSLSSKKCKRFWIREIFKKRAAYGIYNSLVHELRIGIEFCFK